MFPAAVRFVCASLAVPLAVGCLVAAAAPAHADDKPYTCTHSVSTKVMTVTLGAARHLYVERGSDSTTIYLGTESGGALACDAATVNNTDTIHVTAPSASGVERTFSASSGLRPGATAEAIGDSEIEITTSGFAVAELRGSELADDVLRAGADGMNGNNDDDVDVWAASGTIYQLAGGHGNDTLRADGSSGVSDGPDAEGAVLVPGPGSNTVVGGSGTRDVVDFLEYGGTLGMTSTMTSATGGLETDVMSGIEVLRGTPAADTLTGDAGDNTFAGRRGGDAIDGGAGIDTYSAEFGPDVVIDLGTGTVTRYGSATETLTGIENAVGSPYDDLILGTAGDNRLDGNGGDDSFAPGAGDDVVVAHGRGTVTYEHLTAAVHIWGQTAMGAAGNDELGDVGTIIGTAYDDVMLFPELFVSPDWVPPAFEGGPGDDRVSHGSGGDGHDTLDLSYAASGWGTLGGVSGLEDVIGSAGPDFIEVESAGVHDISLRDGVDRVSFYPLAEGVTVTLDDMRDDGPDGLTNVGADVENVTGGAGPNFLYGGPGPNLLEGGQAADVLVGRGGADQLWGDAGNDVLHGLDGADVLYGEGGLDTLLGGAGDDRLVGGFDNDTLSGGNDSDTLRGGDGNDRLSGNAGDDDAFGEAGNDVLAEPESAANGSDLLSGGTGVDSVTYAGRASAVALSLDARANDGGSGELDHLVADIEHVTAGSGSDRIVGSSAANLLRGGPGNDTIDGAAGPDSIYGDSGSDTVTYASRTTAVVADLDNAADDGGAGEKDNVRSDVEHVIGGSAGDRLTGSSLANRLTGGGGNDTLTGLGGADSLDGGSHDDTIYARDGVRDVVVGGTGTDRAQVDSADTRSTVETLL